MLNKIFTLICFSLPILSSFKGFDDYEKFQSFDWKDFGDYEALALLAFKDIDEYEMLAASEAQESTYVPDPDLANLEDSAQDFVLETKRIRFPKFPDAFNPSITRWKGRLLMCFRTYHPATRSTNEIAISYLDENFDPVETPTLIKFQSRDPYCLLKRQDPRLIPVGDRLYIVYNNVINDEIRRMVVAELLSDGNNFFVKDSECILRFDGEKHSRSEKNWVPFDYNGELHFAYSLIPHRILHPLFGTSTCEVACHSLSTIQWNWGVLRGGTPALLQGDEYLAFFHSCKNMATQHSYGKNIPHYFMGAYTFSSKPPFAITRISPNPIIGKNFYKGKSHKTWKPVRVVFPGGFVSDEKYHWVLYGRQDHEIWIAKLDKKALLESLVPVNQK